MSEHEPLTKDCTCWMCDKVVPIATIERHLRAHTPEEYQRAVRQMLREQRAIAAARKPDPEPLQISEKKYSEPSDPHP
jgi:hypothetical protein